MFHKDICVAPEEHEHKVFLTDFILVPKTFENHENMVTIMFETFGVSSIYTDKQAVITLYVNGFTTGMLVNCEYRVTDITPI